MTKHSYLEKTTGVSLEAFQGLSHEQRTESVHAAVKDLHFFFGDGAPLPARNAPDHTRALAVSLAAALESAGGAETIVASRASRIVTDGLLRHEADRDQNVYLGGLFTRTLTHAVPDLIFLPATIAEAASALAWARRERVPVTIRGAASTAMGGAVPQDGGLVLDISRLDGIELDAEKRTCTIGAGARFRQIHAQLATAGVACTVYPSNLGGTYAGWFVTGGIGMNAYGHGRAVDHVRAADLLLPGGEHVRLHADGRMEAANASGELAPLDAAGAERWFRERALAPLALADLAGSEGVLGLVLGLTVAVEPLPAIGAFLLAFASREDALAAASWVHETSAADAATRPANVKLLSASHMHHVRAVWAEEDARAWRRRPGDLARGVGLPWTRIAGPDAFGVSTVAGDGRAAAYLFVDFFTAAGARAFAGRLDACPGAPRALGPESVRVAHERFKPQQTKRLGPGLLAAEIIMPSGEVAAYLPKAEALARAAKLELDAEVYYLADGHALVIAGYLTDHRSGAFALDLVVAPALLDLAIRSHGGKPYVLGRWQAAFATRRFGARELARLRALKQALDPESIVNRGVLFAMTLNGPLGAFMAGTFGFAVSAIRVVLTSPALSWVVPIKRGFFGLFPGPAAGRGAPARRMHAPAATNGQAAHALPATPQVASARALHCVNCGECNSVCPIFHESKIRLPQMLTHIGESMHGGHSIGETGAVLLDLCMRCGNCEEVCQAGIPHLPLYEAMQARSDAEHGRDRVDSPEAAAGRERHVAMLASLRGSDRYMRDFLGVRPGGYKVRAPASLPGVTRYVLMRAEGDAGPAATCIHCAACVDVCPTGANQVFAERDPRLITTNQHACIGCGTCVEVCPANHLNGGQTLRVMEAPTRELFAAFEEFERTTVHRVPLSSS